MTTDNPNTPAPEVPPPPPAATSTTGLATAASTVGAPTAASSPPPPTSAPGAPLGVTGFGSVVVQGMILLPRGTAPVARVVVTGASGRVRLLSAGVRADPGTAAVLPGDLLVTLGPTIRWRPATWGDVVHYKAGIKLQLLGTLLTLVAAVFSALTSFVGTRSPTTPAFTADTGPVVLVIAFLLAAWKVVSDIRTDLSS
jgi:hypothetical protein